jgi:hypothetical protein
MNHQSDSSPQTTSESSDNSVDSIFLTVRLSAWEWHHLLREIEDGVLCVVNRDNENAGILYSKIATQLAGYKVRVPSKKSSVSPDDDKSSQGETKTNHVSLGGYLINYFKNRFRNKS